MVLKKIVNLKLYFALTFLTTSVCLLLSKNLIERISVLFVVLAVIISQSMLVNSVLILTQSEKIKDAKSKKGKAGYLLVAKTGVLILGLSFGVHFMGTRVIIPVLNYVMQIFILALSFKQKD